MGAVGAFFDLRLRPRCDFLCWPAAPQRVQVPRRRVSVTRDAPRGHLQTLVGVGRHTPFSYRLTMPTSALGSVSFSLADTCGWVRPNTIRTARAKMSVRTLHLLYRSDLLEKGRTRGGHLRFKASLSVHVEAINHSVHSGVQISSTPRQVSHFLASGSNDLVDVNARPLPPGAQGQPPESSIASRRGLTFANRYLWCGAPALSWNHKRPCGGPLLSGQKASSSARLRMLATFSPMTQTRPQLVDNSSISGQR